MATDTALERLNAGEAVHPDDMTDAELLALLPVFASVVRRATVRVDHFVEVNELVESECAA